MKTGILRLIPGIVIAVLLPAVGAQAVVRYVALDGSGKDGQSWATAYKTIQAAINDAAMTTGGEVWVKQGTYTVSGPVYVNKAIKLYGGFSGVGSTRNYEAYPTIVDGAENAKHCFEVVANARIDGFAAIRGYAWGLSPYGGGMYIHDCSATVVNCTFRKNYAMEWGGGVATSAADGSVVEDCVFLENVAGEDGGGMHNYQSSPTVSGCAFRTNKAGADVEEAYGGGVMNVEGSPIIADCTFTGNSANFGAGLCNDSSDATVEGCTFADCNTATIGGGGIYNFAGAPTISRCLFQRNTTSHRGGAILDKSGSLIANCIMWNNTSMLYGGAVYLDTTLELSIPNAQITNCTMYGNRASTGGGLYSFNAAGHLTNCIIWGNQAYVSDPGVRNYVSYWPASETSASYCDVQGNTTFPGTGNMRVDPQFVDPAGGDFHLSLSSPCVDKGSNVAGTGPQDCEGNPRIVDGDENGTAEVDMGALEFQGRPDPMKRGEITQGVMYDGPTDTSATYTFTLMVESDNIVDHIEFQAPGGSTVYTIPNTPHTVVGNVETYHRVEGSTHIWEYRAEFDNPASLAPYGDGIYRIMARCTDASVRETQVMHFTPGTSNPVAQPTQKPQITSPVYDAEISSPVALAWAPCTDGNANAVFLVITNAGTGAEVAADTYAKSATGSDGYSLSAATYRADLVFANMYEAASTDGTPFRYGKMVLMEHRFSVSSGGGAYDSVYRFWSPVMGCHFYTIDEAERDKVISDYPDAWSYEGPVFQACKTQSQAGLAPVYRFWSGQSHFYTIDGAEKDQVIRDYPHVWTFEGIAFYAYPAGAQPAECKPVYRFWKAANNTHFYTIDEAEKNKVINDYPWVYSFEGIAYYAYP